MNDGPHPDFGPCCACERAGTPDAPNRNLIMLHRLAPVPGTGWGCLICHLPSDGALAVLCDDCVKGKRKARFAVLGLLIDKGRLPVEQLTGEFDHNLDLHRQHDALEAQVTRFYPARLCRHRPQRAN